MTDILKLYLKGILLLVNKQRQEERTLRQSHHLPTHLYRVCDCLVYSRSRRHHKLPKHNRVCIYLIEYLVEKAMLFAKIKLNWRKKMKKNDILHNFNFFCSLYWYFSYLCHVHWNSRSLVIFYTMECMDREHHL